MKPVILIFVIVLIALPLVTAADSFIVPQSSIYDLKVSCAKDGGLCSATALCNITVNYPNSSILVDNQIMTNLDNGYFNYTLNDNQTSVKGEYNGRAWCVDTGVNDTQTFTYSVNPTGIRPTESRTESVTRSVYFIFGIGSLLFVAFLFTKKPPIKWTYFIFAIIFFLIALNTLFISMQDEVINPKLETFFSSFTVISFYFYWFAAGLLILMWVFTFLNTMLLKKNLDNVRRFGGS